MSTVRDDLQEAGKGPHPNHYTGRGQPVNAERQAKVWQLPLLKPQVWLGPGLTLGQPLPNSTLYQLSYLCRSISIVACLSVQSMIKLNFRFDGFQIKTRSLSSMRSMIFSRLSPVSSEYCPVLPSTVRFLQHNADRCGMTYSSDWRFMQP